MGLLGSVSFFFLFFYPFFWRWKFHLYLLQEQVVRLSNKSKASWLKQLYTLTDRSFVNMTRDVGYYWLRIFFYFSIGVSIGSMYFKIGRTFLDIIARAKCQAFVYGFMICLSAGGLPSFIEEHKVTKKIINLKTNYACLTFWSVENSYFMSHENK